MKNKYQDFIDKVFEANQFQKDLHRQILKIINEDFLKTKEDWIEIIDAKEHYKLDKILNNKCFYDYKTKEFIENPAENFKSGLCSEKLANIKYKMSPDGKKINISYIKRIANFTSNPGTTIMNRIEIDLLSKSVLFIK